MPPKERASLAHELISSLDDEEDTDIENVWDDEINRRVEQIKNGTAKGRSAEAVLSEIRTKYL